MEKTSLVTINDVARMAGVSKSTVSNVVNQKGNVSEKTVARVMQVCNQLNYYPNFAASTLANRRTGIFGLFIYDNTDQDDFERNLHLSLIEGLVVVSARVDMQMMIYYKTDVQKLQHIIDGKGPLDGAIILRPSHNDFRINTLSERAIKTVLIGTPYNGGGEDILHVDVNNVSMTHEIMETLIRRGKKRFLFFNSRADYSVSQERHTGFYNALAAHSIDPSNSMMVNIVDPQKGILEMTHSFLQTHQKDVAIITTFSGTSSIIRQCAAVRQHHAVIFDYERLNVDYKALGQAAFRLLQTAIENGKPESNGNFPYEITYSGLQEE